MSLLFGAAYYPEHRDPACWGPDLDLVVRANMNVLRVAEFAWSTFEPADGAYAFDWMDRFVELAAARRIDVMMCPPIRTAPAWLVEQDPAIQIVDSHDVRLGFGSRYTFCINHPLLRRKGLALASALARRYGAHPAVTSWHLDNEYGDEVDCHCPVCQARWHAWLEKRYRTVAGLNEAWGTVFWGLTFTHFGQAPTPRKTKALHNPALWLAWRQFRSDCTAELMTLHADALRPHIGGRPVTTNFQTLWNSRTDYEEAAECLDVAGLNYYPGFGPHSRGRELGLAVARGSKKKNIWVLETAPGPSHQPGHPNGSPDRGELPGIAAHMIANGVDGIVYFRWGVSPFGCEQHIFSIVGYDGKPRRGFDELAETGARLRRLTPLLEGSEVRSRAAVFYDFKTRWYLENSCESPGSPWTGSRDLFLQRAQLAYRSLRAQGYNVDAAGRRTDLSGYRLLVVPLLPNVDDELAARFKAFVEGGGILVWHPFSGFGDRDANVYPRRLHPVLEELFGVRVDDYVALRTEETVSFESVRGAKGFGGKGGLFADLVEPAGAAVRAVFADGWMKGKPAITERAAGKGRAIHVSTFPDPAFYESFWPAFLKDAGVEPDWGTPLPAGAEAAVRTRPDGTPVSFLINIGATPVRVPLARPMRDHWEEESLSGEAVLGPYGVRVLTAG